MILSEKIRQPATPFAFFDFDGTLTRSDTLMPFLHHYAGSTQYYAKLVKLSPVLLGYFAQIVPNDVAKERVLTEFIGQANCERVMQAACTFVERELPTHLLPLGMEKLKYHQELDHYCVLVSASPELYLQQWAQQHGFDALLGTQLQIVAQHFTGKISGENCFGEAKVRRIEAAFGTDCWVDSFAYSDSRTDMPMLAKSAHGFLLRKQQFEEV